MKRIPKLVRLGLAAVVSVSAVFGMNTQAAELQTVRLGMLPIVTQAPVFLGQELGYFKDEGLEIKTRMFQGGPEITAAVISGDIDYGYANTVSPLLAFAQGAPLRIVANSENADDSIVDGILVKKGSPISRFKDLEGKRVAVNALKGILELVTREGVRLDGGNPDKVIFVEAPFPQMGALLGDGQVDAVVNVEPFITMMVEKDSKVVANAFEVIKGAPMGIWFATEQKVKNKELLDRFRRAIAKSNIYAKDHPKEVRRIIQTFTRINPDAASKIALPAWTADLEAGPVQLQIDMLTRHKFLRKGFSATEIIAK